MYIAPDTTIRILKGVPLDPTYDHTIYFTSAANQTSYFQGKTKYTLDDQMYQRVQRGYINVEVQAENLYDCNYVMFQNTAFGTKWFYAFIKSVEYVNNKVSKIEFQIDVMQTWFFNYTLDRCFVEREHSASDNLFENLVAENVDLGNEYVCNASEVYDMNAMSVCIVSNRRRTMFPSQQVLTPCRLVDGVVNCLQIDIINITDNNGNIITPSGTLLEVDEKIDSYDPAEIVFLYQFSTVLLNNSPLDPVNISPDINTTIDGYTPHNKKLFVYPYNFLLCSNNSGKTATYKWELSTSLTGTTHEIRFKIRGTVASNPVALCFPTHYSGLVNNYDAGIEYANYPTVAWSGDPWKEYWLRNQNTYTMSMLSAGISGIAGLATLMGGNPAGITAMAGAGASIGQLLAREQDIKNTPPQTNGHAQTDTVNAKLKKVQFDFRKMSIKREFAEIIDSYFDRFGYATHKNKVPNRNVRPHWCYTKTVDCTITGSIPCDDAAKICNIYNNGITFWKNGSEVGNYTLDNRV